MSAKELFAAIAGEVALDMVTFLIEMMALVHPEPILGSILFAAFKMRGGDLKTFKIVVEEMQSQGLIAVNGSSYGLGPAAIKQPEIQYFAE